jgi:FkbM family methyltransferase
MNGELIRKHYSVPHPWELIGWKIGLYLVDKLPISYGRKMEFKRYFFREKYLEFSRDKLRICKERNVQVYDLGLFKICIITDSEYFPLNNLEINLTYEFLDIIYPQLKSNYYRLILIEGPYENRNVVLEEGDYVVDCGANLGVFSFLCSIKVGDKGRVFAIEPVGFFIECLQESLKVNCMKNISLLEVALGGENREETIYLDSEEPGGSSIGKETSHPLQIRQVTLDSLVFEKKEIPRVDFLKMDIEGSERNAILGARETIFKFKPRLSISTYHLKDDPIILQNIIKSIDPNYKIEMGRKKLYAKVLE